MTQELKEITEHGRPISATLVPANPGYQADAIVINFEDGWSCWLSQAAEVEIGAVYVEWVDPEGEFVPLG